MIPGDEHLQELIAKSKADPPEQTQHKRPIYYTNVHPIPPHPGLNLFENTHATWQRQCWESSPPTCPWCGVWFVRRETKSKSVIAGITVKATLRFCSDACAVYFEKSLHHRFIPTEYRKMDWPGKEEGYCHPDVALVYELWRRLPKREDNLVLTCGAMCTGIPTNTFPLRPDRRGKACSLPAGHGTDHPSIGRCALHQGKQVRSSVKYHKILAERKMRENNMIFGTSVQVTPEDAIMQELWRTNGAVEWYRQKIEQISSEEEEGGGEDAAITQFTKLGMTPSVWVALYNEERDRLATIAKTASSMGIAERSIRIVEEQGRLLASVIQTLVSHPKLALTPMQQVNSKDVIREVLSTIKMPGIEKEVPNTHEDIKSKVIMADGLSKGAHDFIDALDADVIEEVEEL